MIAAGGVVAASLATPAGVAPRRGPDLPARELAGPVAVTWDEDGTISFVGPADDAPAVPLAGDPGRGCLVPGFVDCHTHLPFVGWRADEFEARLQGVSYAELHGAEGGIFRSSRLLREAEDDEMIAFSLELAREMSSLGTTALELKTGYGLSVEQELRQARLARRLAEEAPQTCTVTLLACHAVPVGMTREDWVRVACDELIPTASAEGLADQLDIYVEDIAFSLDDLERVAAAASDAGVPLRVHADQLGPSGAAEAAVRLGARSADHLNHCGPEGVAALVAAEATAAVLLPASTFFLRAGAPPVDDLRTSAAVAIATDLNPGTSPVCSMPEALAFACTIYGMPPLEALTAATLNPAWVLGLDDRLGSLEVGKRADVVLLDGRRFAQVPYRPGHAPVEHVWVGGEPDT